MVRLRHEIWDYPPDAGPGASFRLASLHGNALDEIVSPGGRVVTIFYASSALEAFETYYRLQGFGTYTPEPAFHHKTYGPSDLWAQLAEFPEDAILVEQAALLGDPP